jgi:lipoprotein-anchoring transpeptidase ErfK/SrfK
MRRQKIAFICIFSLFLIVFFVGISQVIISKKQVVLPPDKHYWFILHRKSNKEFLYLGVPGNLRQSFVVKEFKVKAGIPGERPTPLPAKLGKKYWILTDRLISTNPETAPYFLTLNIPAPEDPPFGPSPYNECNGQCNWEVAGDFGLHGVNGDKAKLDDKGSSGCIRHSDEDITYLYNHLDPKKEEIRYYIVDS